MIFRRFFEDFSMIFRIFFDDFLKKNRRVLQLFAFLTTVKGGWSRKCGLGMMFRRFFEDFSKIFRRFFDDFLKKTGGFCNFLLS